MRVRRVNAGQIDPGVWSRRQIINHLRYHCMEIGLQIRFQFEGLTRLTHFLFDHVAGQYSDGRTVVNGANARALIMAMNHTLRIFTATSRNVVGHNRHMSQLAGAASAGRRLGGPISADGAPGRQTKTNSI